MVVLTICFAILMFVWMGIAIHSWMENEKRDTRIKELERDLMNAKNEQYQTDGVCG